MTPEEHETFIKGLAAEETLRRQLSQLQDYRRKGITTIQETHTYLKCKTLRVNTFPLHIDLTAS